MEPQREQSFANHARRLPPLYVAGAAAAVLALGAGLWELVARPSPGAAGLVLAALGAGAGIYFARINALVVQTRLVCLEERLRLERLLPAPLAARLPELGTDQLVATRFACDEEVAELVRQVLDEKLTSRNEIKRRVRTWRADWRRV
jgi:hypothetical protein